MHCVMADGAMIGGGGREMYCEIAEHQPKQHPQNSSRDQPC